MFELLNKTYKLTPPELFLKIQNIKNENDVIELKKYLAYCDKQVSSIISSINEYVEENKDDDAGEIFEKRYQGQILRRIEDVSNEVFMIGELLAIQTQENKYLEEMKDEVDMLKADLMSIPDKINIAKLKLTI